MERLRFNRAIGIGAWALSLAIAIATSSAVVFFPEKSFQYIDSLGVKTVLLLVANTFAILVGALLYAVFHQQSTEQLCMSIIRMLWGGAVAFGSLPYVLHRASITRSAQSWEIEVSVGEASKASLAFFCIAAFFTLCFTVLHGWYDERNSYR